MSVRNPLLSALSRVQKGRATAEELEKLRAFVSSASSALEDAQVRERYHISSQDIIALLDIAVAISACVEAGDVVRVVSRHMIGLLSVDACVVSRLDQSKNALILWDEDQPPDREPGMEEHRPLDLKAYPGVQEALENNHAVQLRFDEITSDGRELDHPRYTGIRTSLVLPLISQENKIGLIEALDTRSARTFNQREITLGMLLANNAAVAIEKTWLFQEVRQRSAELEAIRKASLSLTASLDLNEVLDTILENSLDLLSGVQDAHIFLYSDRSLSFGAALWADGRKGQPWSNPRPEGLTYTVARTGEVIIVDDMQDHELYKGVPASWQGSIVGLPLKFGERVVGVMTVAQPKPAAFSQANLRVLRLLGDQAAIAIENARLHNLVARQARTDALTDLPNRRALNARLEEEIQRASRYKHSLSLLMIDLNNFKTVNDTFGHPVGDRVLIKVSQCLRQAVREVDFICRYGGDEFVIVLPETDAITSGKLAQRLAHILSECPLDLPEGPPVAITLCIGMAVFPSDGLNGDDLITAADQALYRSKLEQGV
ncbi:MAG TPA: diguanylate cyclase [Anaerolineales bacterium]